MPQLSNPATLRLSEAGIPTQPRINAGASFDRYLLLGRIGQGGMGEVHLAQHARLTSRYYAIKFIKTDFVPTDLRRRFESEIDALERLKHPNIVFAEDAGEFEGCAYLAMEYVDGRDLASISAQFGALPVPDAAEIIRQASLGLQHAHEQALVHRDLKPSNLVLSRSGVVKILDLGLARIRDQVAEQGLTGSMQLLGTPDYMAPEQCQCSKSVDIRADIYSLGCTLYCLLSGRPPFGDEGHSSIATKLTAQLAETPASIADVSKQTIPAELSVVVMKMIAKKPAERYQTPQEVVDVLAPFASGASLSRLTVGSKSAEEMANQITIGRMQASEETDDQRRNYPAATIAGSAEKVVVRKSSSNLILATALGLGMLGFAVPYSLGWFGNSKIEQAKNISAPPISPKIEKTEVVTPSLSATIAETVSQPNTSATSTVESANSIGTNEKQPAIDPTSVGQSNVEPAATDSRIELPTIPLNEPQSKPMIEIPTEIKESETERESENEMTSAGIRFFGEDHAGGDLDIRLTTVGNVVDFTSDDAMQFEISANRSCYIYILTLDSANDLMLLVPNKWHLRGLAVNRGESVVFPTPEMGFEFFPQPPYGPTVIKVIASTTSVPFSDIVNQRVAAEGFIQLGKTELVRDQKMLVRKEDQKSEDGVDFFEILADSPKEKFDPKNWATAKLTIITSD